jgi:hypothetical protein
LAPEQSGIEAESLCVAGDVGEIKESENAELLTGG